MAGRKHQNSNVLVEDCSVASAGGPVISQRAAGRGEPKPPLWKPRGAGGDV